MRRPPAAPRSRRSSALVAAALIVAAVMVVTASVVVAPASAQSPAGDTPKVVPQSLRVRAMGDGVTAGFGYDTSGAVVPVTQRSACAPIGELPVGRCSSNSRLGPGAPADEPSFSADFGLANGVSWAAQVSRSLGATDFANYAVSGSGLVNWMSLPHDDGAPAEGSLHGLLDRIVSDDPDLVLVSLGGSILLQLPNGPAPACAVLRDQETQSEQFDACITAILDRTNVKQRLMAISFDLLARTLNARLVFATYETPFPVVSSLDSWQLRAMTRLVNGQIRDAVAAVGESGATWASRIAVAGRDLDLRRTDFSDMYMRADLCASLPRTGLLGFSDKTMAAHCPLVDWRTSPLSLGTVPTAETQTLSATSALQVIGANGWG